MTGTQYKVYITPRLSDSEYGDEIDVSDRITLKGLNAIKKNIDGGDYDVGAFTYSDVSLTCHNSDGYFNPVGDSRSMFPYSRDLAKVRVVYFQRLDEETITYRGIINEEATKTDAVKEEVTFRVLSRDSVIQKYEIEDGTDFTNLSVSEALLSIFNADIIQKVLNVAEADINVDFDPNIDSGSSLTDRNARDVIKEFLLASNSIMVIDEDDNIIVKPRTENLDKEPLRLYGPGDLKSRENIVTIQNYNTGLQRTFNSVSIDTVNVKDTTSILAFGARKKDVSLDWVTQTGNRTNIANAILGEFKYPKIEFEVTIDTFLAKEFDILDRVSVDFPLKVHPASFFLPISGAFSSGDEDYKTPYTTGSVVIDPRIVFKIIAITEDPKSFNTTFKLRQAGTEINDGYF